MHLKTSLPLLLILVSLSSAVPRLLWSLVDVETERALLQPQVRRPRIRPPQPVECLLGQASYVDLDNG